MALIFCQAPKTNRKNILETNYQKNHPKRNLLQQLLLIDYKKYSKGNYYLSFNHNIITMIL